MIPTYIIGCDCIIGDNCKIGANPVVIEDVPDNSTAVAVPVHIIKK
jgi:serine O-acetyltransferase